MVSRHPFGTFCDEISFGVRCFRKSLFIDHKFSEVGVFLLHDKLQKSLHP